jgi:hypothetical protein
MRGRIEKLARVLEAVNRRLAPPPLHRLNHQLLTRCPLVWRTGLLWVVWWSAVACVGAVALAALRVGSPADVPSTQVLADAHIWATYATGCAFGIWCAFQLKQRIGELPLRRHLHLLLLNLVAIVTLFLPGRAYMLASTYLAARTIPDAVFQSEYDWHKEYNFWICSPELTPEVVTQNRARLDQALGRFGLSTSGRTSACMPGTLSLELNGPGAEYRLRLEEKLTSIAESKALWRHFRGTYHDSMLAESLASSVLGFLLALALGLASHPAYAWRRSFAVFRLRYGPALPTCDQAKARSYGRCEGRLIRKHSLLWAARIHYIPAAVVLLVATMLALSLPFFGVSALRATGEDRFQVLCTALLLAGYAWPYVWLLLRRRDVAAVPTTPRRAQVASYFFATLPVSALLLVIGLCVDPPSDEFLITLALVLLAAFISASFAVTLAVVRTHQGRLPTLLSVTGALTISFLSTFLLLVWPVVAFVRARRPVSAWRRAAATVLIVATPEVVVMTAWLLSRWCADIHFLGHFSRAEGLGDFRHSSLVGFVALVGAMALAALFFFLWVLPLAKILARSEYEPKAE